MHLKGIKDIDIILKAGANRGKQQEPPDVVIKQ
jgi:hypothetical protein